MEINSYLISRRPGIETELRQTAARVDFHGMDGWMDGWMDECIDEYC